MSHVATLDVSDDPVHAADVPIPAQNPAPANPTTTGAGARSYSWHIVRDDEVPQRRVRRRVYRLVEEDANAVDWRPVSRGGMNTFMSRWLQQEPN